MNEVGNHANIINNGTDESSLNEKSGNLPCPNDGTKQSSGLGQPSSSKQTQAQLLGKTAGRWTHAEHKKFVMGKSSYILCKSLRNLIYLICSFEDLRKRLEKG